MVCVWHELALASVGALYLYALEGGAAIAVAAKPQTTSLSEEEYIVAVSRALKKLSEVMTGLTNE